jgi:pimeloyl-ACP methyl ester carboxylesterase
VDPTIRYAMNGDVAIAYEVIGEGPVDLVALAPINNLEIVWENPLYARYLRRLADFSRVILLDRRGTGLSDRFSPNDLPPLEDLADDIVAVLDAVGSERAILFGFSDAGSQCAMLAATKPERTAGLILYAAAASGTKSEDYPWQWSATNGTRGSSSSAHRTVRMSSLRRPCAPSSLPMWTTGGSVIGGTGIGDWR